MQLQVKLRKEKKQIRKVYLLKKTEKKKIRKEKKTYLSIEDKRRS